MENYSVMQNKQGFILLDGVLSIAILTVLCLFFISNSFNFHKSFFSNQGSINASIVAEQKKAEIENTPYDSIQSESKTDLKNDFFYETTVKETTTSFSGGFEYKLSFNGTNSYIRIPIASQIPVGTSPRTVELIMNPIMVNNPSMPFNYGAIVTGRAYGIELRNNHLYFWGEGYPVTDFFGSTTLSNDIEYHTAISYDGSTVRMYLNGALDSSAGRSLNTAASDIYIGEYIGGDTWYGGTIKEVRVWNYARSQAEINTYKDKSLVGNEPGLVGYYKINEGIGNIAYDSSPYHNNGTIYNGIWIAKPAETKSSFLKTINLKIYDKSGAVVSQVVFSKMKTTNKKYFQYFVVDVFDHYAAAYGYQDGATISEIELYNQSGQKTPYSIPVVYDSVTGCWPYYWSRTNLWGRDNLNDGDIYYVSNGTGGTSSLILVYPIAPNSQKWARIVIDAGTTQKIESLLFYIGSPEARTPKAITIYGADSYTVSNYNARSNIGLTKVGEILPTGDIPKVTLFSINASPGSYSLEL